MSAITKIDMLTRVEGHGSVELIREGQRVVGARLNLYESPRLFEALLIGRRFDEIPDIACRICSICSTVHKVAALQAVEQALGISVSEQTRLSRELAVQGGQIESHALHIFCLALPDYLKMSGIQELAERQPEKLQLGLGLKKLGNRIQETVGGRAIHPFNLLVGGVGKTPDPDVLHNLMDRLLDVRDAVMASIRYISGLNDILPLLPLHPTCTVSGGSPLFGDCLMTSASQVIPAHSAAAWLNEQVELHTNAKVSHFDGIDTFIVGPIARLSLSPPSGFTYNIADTSIRSSLKARAIELQQAVERSVVLIEQLLGSGMRKEEPVVAAALQGEGCSLIEAPRGVLLHSYRFDERGICMEANIVTPTAINQGAIAVSLEHLLAIMEGATDDEIRSAAEILVRCYDPCISCSVH